jgi:hypothetical protein
MQCIPYRVYPYNVERERENNTVMIVVLSTLKYFFKLRHSIVMKTHNHFKVPTHEKFTIKVIMQMSSVDLIYYTNFLEQYDISAYVLSMKT